MPGTTTMSRRTLARARTKTGDHMDDSAWWELPVLESGSVRLEPLAVNHASAWAGQHDPELFAFMARGGPLTPDETGYAALITRLIERSRRLNWAILVNGSFGGRISAIDVDPGIRQIEIGTMLTPSQLGGIANPGSKLLLMSRYFDHLGMSRCLFKVDERNARSRRAMTKIGAIFTSSDPTSEIHGGATRHDVVYAVSAAQWPKVKAGLERRVAQFEEVK
jgi:RimJ/RimL family protein N-acetyltransferase